jgi:hypothetical protein
MKPLTIVPFFLLAMSVGIFSCSSSKYASTGNSEYDDMYFNKGDRYPVMVDGTTAVQRTNPDGGVGTGYNSKTLNPDYGLPQDAQTGAEYSDNEYYVENHDDAYIQKAVDDYLRNNSTANRYTNPRYHNNFDDVFWSDPLYYQGTIYDPLYRSYYGVYSPFAYNSYYRPYSSFYNPWGPRISVSLAFGYGYGYGSPWGRYYDPFYYGGGFGYGYGYARPYGSYYGSAWCPPSYYGGYNNVVVINNIENSNPGNVRYGTRQPRGTSYIVNNSPRERTSANTSSDVRSIRTRADNAVRDAGVRTINNNNGRVQQYDRTGNVPSATQYNQSDRSNSRFRTHSLDSKNSSESNAILQQRSRAIKSDKNVSGQSRNRSTLDGRNYTNSPSGTSGSRQYQQPSRTSGSDAIKSRSNYSRSSNSNATKSRNYAAPSRSNSSSGRSNYTAPSRSNYSSPGRSSNSSSPSRSSYSAPSSGSSSSSPSRSMPSRTGGARSVR